MARYFAKTTAIWLAAITIPLWVTSARAFEPQPDYDAPHQEWARVLDAQPVIEHVQIPATRRVCRNETVTRRVPEYRSPAPVIVGAILGGVIGSELSRGHGHGHHGYGYRGGYRHYRGHGGNRAAGTLAGAAIGGLIGSSVQYGAAPPRYYDEVVDVCRDVTRYREEDHVVAWDVTWEFHGQVYHSRMDEEPGERIRVSVRPIGR